MKNRVVLFKIGILFNLLCVLSKSWICLTDVPVWLYCWFSSQLITVEISTAPYLSKNLTAQGVPRAVQNNSGKETYMIQQEGRKIIYNMITFIQGWGLGGCKGRHALKKMACGTKYNMSVRSSPSQLLFKCGRKCSSGYRLAQNQLWKRCQRQHRL